jgi:hypothetical protein
MYVRFHTDSQMHRMVWASIALWWLHERDGRLMAPEEMPDHGSSLERDVFDTAHTFL